MLGSLSKRQIILVLASAATIGLGAGCASTTDLNAVQQYGQTAAAAQDSFNAIALDYAASCSRRVELELDVRELATQPVQLAAGAEFPTPEPRGSASTPSPAPTESPLPIPTVIPSPIATPSPQDLDCASANAVSADWKHGNDIVLGYVQKLGAIAGVDAAPTPFTPLGTALTSANILNGAQNTAISALANDLTQQFIAGDQRQIIAETVKQVNPDLQKAIFALRQVDFAYVQVLNAEFNVTDDYYHCLITTELAEKSLNHVTFKPIFLASKPQQALWKCPTNPSSPSRISLALRNKILGQRQALRDTLNALNQHRAASIAYASVLVGMRDTHRQLYQQAVSNAAIGDYVAVLQRTIIPLFKDVQALQGATK